MNDLEDRLRHMYARVAETANADADDDTTVVPLRPLGQRGARPAWLRIMAAAAALAVLVAGGWLLRQRVADNDPASPTDVDRIYGIPLWVPEGYAFQGGSIDDNGVATLEWRRGQDSLIVESGPVDEMGLSWGAGASFTSGDAKVDINTALPVDDNLLEMLWMVDEATFRAVTAKSGFVTDEWQRWDIPGDPIDGSDLIVTGGLQTGLARGLDLGFSWSGRSGCRAQQIGDSEEYLLMSGNRPVEFHVLMGDGTRRTISGADAPGLRIALATVVGDVQSVECKEPT